MSIELALDVTVRDDVHFELGVTNAGLDPVELTFPDACAADFAVRADGSERWRFSEGQMFAQVLRTETLEPGEEATFSATWEEPDPGEYTAVATLRLMDRPRELTEPFAV